MLNYGARLEHACIFADSAHHRTVRLRGHDLRAGGARPGKTVMVADLTRPSPPARASRSRSPRARRAHVRGGAAALSGQGSSAPWNLKLPARHYDLDASQLPKVHEVVPLFSMAVQRSMEELNARNQPRSRTVHRDPPRGRVAVQEGRARRLERARTQRRAELHPIVFEQVHPLYALSDIRGSSIQRALAIQAICSPSCAWGTTW